MHNYISQGRAGLNISYGSIFLGEGRRVNGINLQHCDIERLLKNVYQQSIAVAIRQSVTKQKLY